jgi:dephospho-CoA kinase
VGSDRRGARPGIPARGAPRLLRGLTTDEARARLASQVDDDTRLAIADVVIDTAGSLAETSAQVEAL